MRLIDSRTRKARRRRIAAKISQTLPDLVAGGVDGALAVSHVLPDSRLDADRLHFPHPPIVLVEEDQRPVPIPVHVQEHVVHDLVGPPHGAVLVRLHEEHTMPVTVR